MSTARRHSSALTSSAGLLAEMPALLTSTSMRPQACSTWAKARSTASASVTEAWQARASPPLGLQAGHGDGQRGLIHVQQATRAPLAREGLGGGVADALGAAGDDDGLAAQVGVHGVGSLLQDDCL